MQQLEKLKNSENSVVSTGGGIILRSENCKILKETFSVYLKADFKNIFKRIEEDKTRPLLLTDDPYNTAKDLFELKSNGNLGTKTNNSGGVQGGISNGEPLFFKVAFKPPATIGLSQQTSTFEGEKVTLEAKGRHDPCVVPRAVPIVEAMSALVLADYHLLNRLSKI